MIGYRNMRGTAVVVPPSIGEALSGYAWTPDRVGESGAAVHRLRGGHDAPDLFLKHGCGPVADDVTDEMIRLRWLSRHIRVPEVVRFVSAADSAWLLTAALPGPTAYQVLKMRPVDRAAVVDALAACLARFHAIPVDACPFTSDHAYRLSQARARLVAGLVDEDDFDDERAGWTAEQVWDAMQRLLPLTPDPVVTHGDFSLDNLVMLEGGGVGCIDVGRAGIADRYQDIAILWNCLGEFDDALQARFLSQYGVPDPDPHRMQFHLMLDELF